MTVPFTSDSVYRPEKSSLLFKGPYLSAYPWGRNYDVSPDGRRFLMLKRKMIDIQQINVILNWFEELKRLCPTGKN